MKELSVLMPVHNHPQFVGDAIESILSQTYTDFDFHIMDDGSEDATLTILHHYANHDPRIRLHLRPHRGICATRNDLLRQTSSRLIAWLDCDDVATPNRLRWQLDAMRQDPELWVLGTALILIGETGRPLRTLPVTTGASNVARQMQRGCKIAQSSSIMLRKPIMDLGGYRPAYETAEDYDLFLRVSEQGKLDNIDVVGLHMRNHNRRASKTFGLHQNMLAEMARIAHARRVSGLPDPTGTMDGPPALDDPILDDLLGEKIAAYRTLRNIELGIGDCDLNLDQILNTKPTRKQRSACQSAIVNLVRQRPLDSRSVRALVRAAGMGAGRLIQELLAHRT